MSENNPPPPEGENINELLSQLKGIFGHLSESEKEESKQKTVPPPLSIPSRPTAPPPEPMPPLFPEPPLEPSAEFIPVIPDEPKMPPEETMPLEPWAVSESAVPLPADNLPPALATPEFTPSLITIPEGSSLIPAAIFYPAGRVQEAKIVAEKVERITPKFTKVTFVLNVQAMAPYDVKTDLKTTVLAQVTQSPLKAVFILADKSMDDSRRRALIMDLESRGIYFQEIAFHQVEKKAIYTDMLLGMVFFFDSQKPASPDANP